MAISQEFICASGWRCDYLSPHGIHADTCRLLFFGSRRQRNRRTLAANFGSRYLVDGLSERDEIWHIDTEGLAIYNHLPRMVNFYSRVPLGSQNGEICNVFLVHRAQWNLAAFRVWPIDIYSPNFVNFGRGSRDTMLRHPSVIQRCTCLKLLITRKRYIRNFVPSNTYTLAINQLFTVSTGLFHSIFIGCQYFTRVCTVCPTFSRVLIRFIRWENITYFGALWLLTLGALTTYTYLLTYVCWQRWFVCQPWRVQYPSGVGVIKAKFHYAILVADRSEDGRRPATSWNLAYHLAG